MDLIVTPIYAGILALLYVALSARVIIRRRAKWISLQDGGDVVLRRRLRVHGNFAEYVPFALLLMIGAEMMLVPHWILHALGLCLIAGRLFHAHGLGREPDNFTSRTIGMVLTFTVLIIGAFLNIIQAILMADFAG